MYGVNNQTRRQRRRIGRRRFVVRSLSLIAGSVTLLTACGGGAQDRSRDTRSESTATAEQPAVGGTLRLAKIKPDDGLDPAGRIQAIWEQCKLYSWPYLYSLSERMIYLDALAKYELPDKETMIFHLRTDLRFQPEVSNGRLVTAEDLKFTIDRAPVFFKTKGGLASPLLFSWIERTETPDNATVVIKQNRPNAGRLQMMAQTNPYAIVARDVVEANGGVVDNVPAGSGPYRLTKRDATGTTLKRWPDYSKNPNPGGPFPAVGAFVDTIESRVLGDIASIKAAYLAGNLDIYEQWVDKFSVQDFDAVRGTRIDRVLSYQSQELGFDFLQWNDPRARQAIVKAVDWDAYMNQIFAGEGELCGYVNPHFEWLALPPAEVASYYKQDVSEAKKLWAAAGNPFGNRITSLATPGPTEQKLLFLQQQLKQNLGVELTYQIVDSTTLNTKVTAPGKKDWHIFVAGTVPPNLPETNSLAGALPSGYAGLWNFTPTNPNPETAAAAVRAEELNMAQLAADDDQDRASKMHALERFLFSGFWGIAPLPHQKWAYIVYRGDRVRNYRSKEAPLTWFAPRFHDLWLVS